MKIWCCLWFGEEEEKEEDKNKIDRRMSEGNLGNEDMENDDVPLPPQGFELGFPLGRMKEEELISQPGGVIIGESQDLGTGRGSNGGGFGGTVGSLRWFNENGVSSSGEGLMEVNLNLGLGEEKPSSSTSSATPFWDNCDRDSQNKRPKVHSLSL